MGALTWASVVGIKLDRCSLGRHDDGVVLFVASPWNPDTCNGCGFFCGQWQMEERSCLVYVQKIVLVVSTRRFDYETLHL